MNAPSRSTKVATTLLLIAVTLIGAALRFYAVDRKGIWLDEAFSIWLGGQPLPDMWSWIARIDQHPPLYYTVLNLWMRMGEDAYTARLLSATAGTLAVPIVFVLGKRLLGTLTGLLAAAALAVSPFQVRFGQEARMYALLELAAAAAMACLVFLLTETTPEEADVSPSRPRQDRLPRRRGLAWAGYVTFTTAAMLTHSSALLLPVAMNLFVAGLLWRRRKLSWASSQTLPPEAGRGRFWGRRPGVATPLAWWELSPAELKPPALLSWLVAQASVFLLWGVIWLPAFINQASGVYREFWLPAPTWLSVIDTLGNLLNAHLPRDRMPWLDVIWVLYGALFALAIAALRRRPAVLALLLTLFLTPFLGELLVSLRRPVFYDRTLIWATIPLYLLLAAGIAALRRWQYLITVIAILIAASAVSLREYYVHFQKEGWREAASYVAQQASESDLVLFNASWGQIPFDYYFRTAGTPLAEHGIPVDLFDRGILEPRMTHDDLPRLRELIRDRERVWLIYSHEWYTDPQRMIPTALAQALTPMESRQYEGITVWLYERPQGD